MSLRDEWKKTGTDLGHAFAGLGKSVVKSVKYGVDKADEWASEEQPAAADGQVHDAEPVNEDKK